MRILVTGGAGFIGSHLCEHLLAAGHAVLVIDDLSAGCRENVPAAAEFIQGSILRQELSLAVQAFRPHAVVHLAAQTAVGQSVADPADDANRNILGTIAVLEACRREGVPQVVYASSAAVYGAPQRLPVDEAHPCDPLSPYGLSKLTAERYLALYHDLCGLRFVALRFANVYGPRQRPGTDGAVVASFASRAVAGEPLRRDGDGEQTRDFVYVADLTAAIGLALHHAGSGVFNVSTGTATSVNQLIAALGGVVGRVPAVEPGPPRPGDIRHSSLDPARIRRELRWQAQVGLSDGLRSTVQWWRDTGGT